jgi:hypothetical protein
VFVSFYKRFLTDRLLNKTSKNQNAENGLLARFRTLMGASPLKDVQTMINDIKTSDEFM